MKKESPISLFSFQDIITCLTGIMIVIVLVILLQLVETTANIAAKVQLQPEYKILKTRMEQMLALRDELKNKLKNSKKEQDEFFDKSTAELKSIVGKERKYTHTLKRDLAKVEKNFSLLVLEIEKTKLRIEKIKNEIRELYKSENEILELKAELLALQKRQGEVSQKIEQKRKTIRFEFSGYDHLKPLLIECNFWGFRAKKYPDGEVLFFGTPQKTNAKRQIPNLMSYLRQEGLYSTYPVLLFRNDSLVIYEDLMKALYEVNKNITIGKEPLGEKEECF